MGNGHAKQPASAQIGDHDRAVLDLKNSRDALKQHQKKVGGRATCVRALLSADARVPRTRPRPAWRDTLK